VRTRAFLASLVPVIVNTVLNEHQLVLDIVAFVAFGDFPRSRLGEKQRGKVLGNWVSRKMRTIAQFSIRDPDAEGSVSTVGPEDGMGRRASGQSGVAGGGSMTQGVPGSSLRHSESITQMPVAEEPSDMDNENLTLHTQHPGPSYERSDSRNDSTPTNERPPPLNTTIEYSPVDRMSFNSPEEMRRAEAQHGYQMRASYGAPESYNPFDNPYDLHEPQELDSSAGGGLRVTNRTSSNGSGNWEQEALRSLNLGGR
jgi:hypothetical protein